MVMEYKVIFSYWWEDWRGIKYSEVKQWGVNFPNKESAEKALLKCEKAYKNSWMHDLQVSIQERNIDYPFVYVGKVNNDLSIEDGDLKIGDRDLLEFFNLNPDRTVEIIISILE